MVLSLALNTLRLTPQSGLTSSGSAGSTSVLPSSAYAAIAACAWPGISISGTTVTKRSAA
ncbi:MAG: hypothetical protein BWY52_02393 [Chloroflexi bacterium ADurb.Bin325]|nr:MAG: hypothetical protein BWY52_02393 [Chloroflexi bacterium ADurb.Bin325]